MNLIKYLNNWTLFSFFMLISVLFITFKFEGQVSYSAMFINLCYLILFYVTVSKSLKKKKENLGNLIFICTLFSLFFLLLFKMLYYNEASSFFEFSAVDSLQYHEFAIRIAEGDFIKESKYFILTNDIEDFGAVFFTSLAYSIYPSTVMFNIFNVIAGIITIASLYRMAIFFISKEYAYYTSLIYGLSSFVIYLYSTGMKETFFTMFVVLFFEFLTRFIKKRKVINLFFSIIFLLILYFFRPAVMFMIIFSILLSVIYTKRKGLLSLLLLLPIIVFAVMFLLEDIETIRDKYYGGADVVSERAENLSGIQASNFNYAVSFISGFFGPLPSYTPIFEKLQQSFYAIGLGLRVFLSIFFWFGFFKLLKGKDFILLSASFFVIFEMFGLSLILESFELRLNSPHLVLVYFISFYYLYINSKKEEMKKINKKIYSLAFVVFLFLIFAWNLRI